MFPRLLFYYIVSNYVSCLESKILTGQISSYFVLVKRHHGQVEYYSSENRLNFSNIFSSSMPHVVIQFLDWSFVEYVKLLNAGKQNVNVTGQCLGEKPDADVNCEMTESYLNISIYKCKRVCRQLQIKGYLKDILKIVGSDSYIENIIGCFESDFNTFRGALRGFEDCMELCRPTNYFALGLGHCFCESNLLQYKAIEAENCSELGGSRYGQYTVYSRKKVMHRDRIPTAECAYNYKDCEDCPSGKYGLYCDIPNCKINNGLCKDKKCVEGIVYDYKIGFCQCKPFYYLTEFQTCSMIDYCVENECHKESTVCLNKLGSYECKCIAGYQPDTPFKCKDIDECTLSYASCDRRANCENTIGSFICVCEEGLVMAIGLWQQTECQDIDECLGNHICDLAVSLCLNLEPGYHCQCKFGFVNVDNFICTKGGPTSERINEDLDDDIVTSTELFSTTISDEIFNEYYAVVTGAFLILYALFFAVYLILKNKAKKAKPRRSPSWSFASPDSVSIKMSI